jgi:hypothetical protein
MDHLGLELFWPGTWLEEEAVDWDDDGWMLASWCGGVAGGEIMPGREDCWRVAVMGR